MDGPKDEKEVLKWEKKGTEKKKSPQMFILIILTPPFSDYVLSWDPRK